MSFKDPEALKFFLTCCLDEINTWGRSGGGLRHDSWTRVIHKLKDSKFKITMTQKQLRNHWDYNKKKYKVWSDMVNKSGHGFNPITNTMDWPEDVWDDYIKSHPDASKFKKGGPQFPELMKSLFDHTNATGDVALAPMSDRPRLNDHVSESSSHMEPTNSVIPKSTKMDGKYSCPSLKACNEKLKEMGISQRDPHYIAAICLFTEKKVVREQWMSIQDMEADLKLEWIKRMANRYGFWKDD